MIKTWKSRIGYFIGAIIGWLPSADPTAAPPPSVPTPVEIVRFSVIVSRSFTSDVKTSRMFSQIAYLSRSISYEVEQ